MENEKSFCAEKWMDESYGCNKPHSKITETQKKQIRYLENQNDLEILRGMWGRSFECSCKTCGTSKHFGAADNARKWLEYGHAGHRTWIDTLNR